MLTAQIREDIYYSLINRRLFPEEQKGCRKGIRRTRHLLYIDQYILNESKTRRKNVGIAGIDDKMAYDVVPQSWIIDWLKMYKISDEVLKFIENTMENWRVGLTAVRNCLAEVKLQREVFYVDALLPLLFVIAMMILIHKLADTNFINRQKKTIILCTWMASN